MVVVCAVAQVVEEEVVSRLTCLGMASTETTQCRAATEAEVSFNFLS